MLCRWKGWRPLGSVKIEDGKKTMVVSGHGSVVRSPHAAMFCGKTPKTLKFLNMNVAFLFCQGIKLEYIFFNSLLAWYTHLCMSCTHTCTQELYMCIHIYTHKGRDVCVCVHVYTYTHISWNKKGNSWFCAHPLVSEIPEDLTLGKYYLRESLGECL